MGYEFHITRAEFWLENEGQEISREAWLGVVERDPELSIDQDNGPLFARWGPMSETYWPWFNWSEGNVFTKNPDRKTLAKLLEIAAQLGANVQGDDGERYTSLDDYPASVDVGETAPDSDPSEHSGLPLALRRKFFWDKFQYIVVALAVLVWVLLDLLRRS